MNCIECGLPLETHSFYQLESCYNLYKTKEFLSKNHDYYIKRRKELEDQLADTNKLEEK